MPGPRLVCLGPAGAGPSLFRPWRLADADIDAPAIPGREARFGEPSPPSLSALADLLASELAPRLPRRYGLFGYSMGGTVALLLAERLADRGLPGPEALFLLGALASHALGAGTRDLHALAGDAFWAEIARIGGTPPEVLADAEMRGLLEPMLRGDFRLCHSYRHQDTGYRLDCPVHVFVADDDHLVCAASADEWAHYTTGPTRLHRLRGTHMLGPDAFAHLRKRIRALWPRPVPPDGASRAPGVAG